MAIDAAGGGTVLEPHISTDALHADDPLQKLRPKDLGIALLVTPSAPFGGERRRVFLPLHTVHQYGRCNDRTCIVLNYIICAVLYPPTARCLFVT